MPYCAGITVSSRLNESSNMNREEWEREYKRLRETPIEPYLLKAGFSAAELKSVPARTYGELPETPLSEMSGTVDSTGFYKHRQLAYLAQKMRFLPIIAELALSGEWGRFSEQARAVYETMPESFTYFYGDMPEEYRRDFAIGCYMHHGDSVKECREAVIELPREGRGDLPEEYREMEELTVYRAGEEPIDEAPRRISWTLDESVARFFMYEYRARHANHLYRARIKTNDVIAYADERNEREIIQHMSVYDVEEMETE